MEAIRERFGSKAIEYGAPGGRSRQSWRYPSLSPDGARLVFIFYPGGERVLFLREAGEQDERRHLPLRIMRAKVSGTASALVSRIRLGSFVRALNCEQ